MTSRTTEDLAFGHWLKQRRQALDLTQDELAAGVGCAPSMLQKIEQGVRRPSRAMAERLADGLALSSEERARFLRQARAPIGQAEVAAIRAAPLSSPSGVTPMLLTKILPPPPRRPIVPRPHLGALLNGPHGGRLTLVVAPAGYRKTTLLSDWAASSASDRQEVAWVTLDEDDADVGQLLRYIIAAVQHARPSLGRTSLHALHAPRPEAALTLLINDIIVSAAPLTLVLDDYQTVRAPAIHQALTYIIEHLPPNLDLVIASRDEPPLPLTRLRARQQVREIRAIDLRFRTDEVAAFFAGVIGLALPQPALVALAERTEGWVVGLQFAALALREQTDSNDVVRSFSGHHRLVRDYLAAEVLAHLPSHLHEFLLQTSILDRFCGPLCDAVMGVGGWGLGVGEEVVHAVPSSLSFVSPSPIPHPSAPDSYSQLVLDQLERANLFLVPLDDERNWYRYHHLFGAMLHDRLRRGAHGEQVALLHRRAAAWFEQHGLIGGALHHARAANDRERVDRLTAWNGNEALLRGAPERPSPLTLAATRDDAPPEPDLLTRREREVLRLIAAGASNGKVAEQLVISVGTVKKHINSIFAKLHAESRTQALVRARERGLL